MSPATNPALASITPTTAASGASGTQLITCTGTNFTPGCRIWDRQRGADHDVCQRDVVDHDGQQEADRAGLASVDVKLGGVAVPSTRTFTWT